MTTNFKLGDIVRLKSGTSPQRVFGIDEGLHGVVALKTQYLSYGECDARDIAVIKWRRATDYVLFDEKTSTTETTEMAKLYEIKAEDGATTRYGTFLAHNSAGKIVLEIKGTGAVEAFDPDQIEEVRPFTIDVLDANGQRSSYSTVKGLVDVGDHLIIHRKIYRVMKVDSKSSTAVPLGEAVKLNTTILTSEVEPADA